MYHTQFAVLETWQCCRLCLDDVAKPVCDRLSLFHLEWQCGQHQVFCSDPEFSRKKAVNTIVMLTAELDVTF